MNVFSKSNKLKAFIVPKTTDIIISLANNGKFAIYKGANICGLYCYLEIIGDSTTLTNSGQCSHHFGPSSFTNNDTATLHPVIAALRVIHKTIF